MKFFKAPEIIIAVTVALITIVLVVHDFKEEREQRKLRDKYIAATVALKFIMESCDCPATLAVDPADFGIELQTRQRVTQDVLSDLELPYQSNAQPSAQTKEPIE